MPQQSCASADSPSFRSLAAAINCTNAADSGFVKRATIITLPAGGLFVDA